MRHKYLTSALVLARIPLGETSALLTLLTPDVGLVRARTQGVRKSGAKLASSLPTYAESEVVLVRGREGWRVAGALLQENWFRQMPQAARPRAARVTGLLLRLVPGEAADPSLYETLREFLHTLARESENEHDSVECLAALRILGILGLEGDIPVRDADAIFNSTSLAQVRRDRSLLVARINRGIEASGL